MAGHIVKRTGRRKIRGKPESLYYLVYVANGKQRWETVDPPRTRKRAETLLAERLSQINRGEFIEPHKTTFEEFKELWLEKYAKGEVRSSTMVQYESLFSCHIIPALGELELSRIGVEDIQGFKAAMSDKDMGPQMIKHNLRLVRQMLDHAVDWGYVRTNPAKKVRYPKIPKRETDCMSVAEVRLFLEKVPERWYAFFLTAITTGLRIGELLAMRWANLDWNGEQYTVKEGWIRPRKEVPAYFAEPKTESSMAPVDLTPTCVDALRAHQGRQAEEKLEAGGKYRDQDLIFATANGGPRHDVNIVSRIYKPTLKEAGIRTSLRFHDLRHTCASLLIAQGESPKYIQAQMRHASIDITFDRYGHLFPEKKREAARRLDETLFGTAGVSIGADSV